MAFRGKTGFLIKHLAGFAVLIGIQPVAAPGADTSTSVPTKEAGKAALSAQSEPDVPRTPAPEITKEPLVTFRGGLLTVSAKGTEIRHILKEISSRTGLEVQIHPRVS